MSKAKQEKTLGAIPGRTGTGGPPGMDPGCSSGKEKNWNWISMFMWNTFWVQLWGGGEELEQDFWVHLE